jgi:DNA-binding CsgD family transcriptional regulator
VQADETVFGRRAGLLRHLPLTGRRWSIVLPLRRRGRSTGVLWVAGAGVLGDDDVAFYSMVASQLAGTAELVGGTEGTLPDPTVAGPVAALTRREREILSLLATGLTSREIAEQLVLSPRTVEWHRSRIQASLGVSGRAELTRIAREARGLLRAA